MAVIDSKKLLPPAKSTGSALTTQKFLVPISNIKVKSSAIIRVSDIKPSEKSEDGGGGKIVLSEVLQIRENITSIQRVIVSNTTILRQSEERKRKLLEKEKFESKEKKLEEKKGLSVPQLKSPPLPKTGFLDAIKRFLFYTLLGAAFVKFGKYIPKILEFSKKLIPAFKFVEDFAGNVLNGAVEFIDKGYKAYDKVREISKTIGGEDLQKKFDEFSKQFNTFANLAIIAGMATMGGTDFKKDSGGRTGGSYTAGYAAGYAAGLASRGKGPRYRSPGQAAAGGTFGENLQRQSLTRDRMLAPTGPRGPFDAINRRFRGAAAQLETGTLFKRGAGAQRALYNAPGKLKSITSKGRAVGKFAGKALGRVPIIGGLIDFIISTVIFKEKPGRAAAKAVGSTIGAALGTFVPVPFAGTILGGILGDIVGGALYDTLVGSKPEAKAQGGQVTRGGRKVSGPARRTIKRVKAKPPKIKPQKTIPGKDVGGRKEIEKLFPYSINPNQRSPLGVLETTSESLKKVPLLGGVMGASLDLAMGQKPDSGVFKKIGYGFGALVQNAIDAETSNTIGNIQKELVGLAGGGAVPRTLSTGQSIGMQIGERLAKTLEAMMNAKVSETLQSIRQQFGKEGVFGETPYDNPSPNGDLLEYEVSGGELPSLYPGRGFGRSINDHDYRARDYQIPVGKAITVFKPGTVTYARLDSSGYGNLVIIRHTDGKQSVYAHLSRINVSEGEEIKEGERKVIGLTGGEAGSPGAGNSTGPHLHFEVKDGRGNRITGYNDGDAYFRFGTVTGVRKRTPLQMSNLQVEPTGRELQGEISWYGPGFYGKKTANGETFTGNEMTAAHKTLPFGTLVRVTWKGRSIVVRINDRGPFIPGRVLDLSRAAAQALGMSGVANGAKIEIVRPSTAANPTNQQASLTPSTTSNPTNQQALLAPSTSPSIAFGLNQEPYYGKTGNSQTLVAIQPIHIHHNNPISSMSGGMISGGVNISSSPITASLYSGA
jgi:rare lipoprotein A